MLAGRGLDDPADDVSSSAPSTTPATTSVDVLRPRSPAGDRTSERLRRDAADDRRGPASATPTSAAGGSSRRRCRSRPRRRCGTSRAARKTSPRRGPSTATPPTRSCIVGRRSRTRGLFLDRRAFLTSYDPTQDDDERAILARILRGRDPGLRRHQPRILLLARRLARATAAARSCRTTSRRCWA